MTPIEQTLKRYTDAEQRIAANLLELDGDATYQLLRASSLQGVTLKRLGATFAQAPTLWRWQRSLSKVLTEVRKLLADEGWGSAKRHAQAAELLRGASVLVTIEQPGPASNDLLGGPVAPIERRVTIEALIAEMRKLYEPISNGLAEVEDRWRDLVPRLDAADATLARCTAEFDSLGIADTNVRQLAQLVAATRADLSTDPLGVSLQVGADIERQVSAQATRVADLRGGHDTLDDDFAKAESILTDLRVTRARAAAAFSEASHKISSPGNLARVPATAAIDGERGLAQRLDRIIEEGANANWQHRRTQLDTWLATGTKMLAQLHRAESKNRGGLDRRDDLRGLLASYQAKAAAMGIADEPTFGDLTDQARNALFTTPTDLATAEALVTRVGDTLRSRRS